MEALQTLSNETLREMLQCIRKELRERSKFSLQCAACSTTFFAYRNDAKYCSTRCRVRIHRQNEYAYDLARVSGTGYEGKSLDELITELKELRITTLVDVRLNAISRKRGFSKTILSETLAKNEISYVHFRALGNPKSNREGYSKPNTSEGNRARQNFINILKSPESMKQLQELKIILESQRVSLFCFESNQSFCHREQIIETLRRLE